MASSNRETQFSLGSRLKALRLEQQLSQRDLASRASLSVNSISLIERNEISPSVSTLQSLASALNIKMGYFFDENVQKKIIHLQAVSRPAITSHGTRIEGVGERIARQEIEPFLVSLDPGSGSGDRPVIHSGHEFVYCAQGQVEYVIDGEEYILQEGDFLLFEAQLPHQWRNITDSQAKFLLILQAPDEVNEPIQRHFVSYPSVGHMG